MEIAARGNTKRREALGDISKCTYFSDGTRSMNSRSMSVSILALIVAGVGMNRDISWLVV